MTTYQHPSGVQLINCDCEYCRANEEVILLVYADKPDVADLRPLTVREALRRKLERTPRYGWAVPNRLYGAEINHEGEAI